MKSRYWAAILVALLAACVVAGVLWTDSDPAAWAQIESEGKVVGVVDLRLDQTLTVQTQQGYNVVTVRDGKIAVTEASCPDHICMARGFCDSGAQIVCLPNRLVIRFLAEQEIDGASG